MMIEFYLIINIIILAISQKSICLDVKKSYYLTIMYVCASATLELYQIIIIFLPKTTFLS